MNGAKLDKIFKPKSIAVIGASETIGSAGYRIFRNLIGSGYDGVVYPVNIKRESIQGVQAYPTINEVPKVVDLAIIVTPATVVCDIVEQCGIRGIKGILIISAGFKEIGPEGVAREQRLLELKKKYGSDYRRTKLCRFHHAVPEFKCDICRFHARERVYRIAFSEWCGLWCDP